MSITSTFSFVTISQVTLDSEITPEGSQYRMGCCFFALREREKNKMQMSVSTDEYASGEQGFVRWCISWFWHSGECLWMLSVGMYVRNTHAST